MAKAKVKIEQSETVEPIVELSNKQALQDVLIGNPHVHVIHVNEEGEWHFMPRPGFTAYERDEILNG